MNTEEMYCGDKKSCCKKFKKEKDVKSVREEKMA
jgi:hypothetical protein